MPEVQINCRFGNCSWKRPTRRPIVPEIVEVIVAIAENAGRNGDVQAVKIAHCVRCSLPWQHNFNNIFGAIGRRPLHEQFRNRQLIRTSESCSPTSVRKEDPRIP